MTLKDIAEKISEKVKDEDRQGVLDYVDEIPGYYSSLIDHPNLWALKEALPKFRAVVEGWWPSINSIDDRVLTFTDLLCSFEKDTVSPQHPLELPWNPDNSNYMPASKAIANFTYGELPMPTLTHTLNNPSNTMHFMRKRKGDKGGGRCKCMVHMLDFLQWVKREHPQWYMRKKQLWDKVERDLVRKMQA